MMACDILPVAMFFSSREISIKPVFLEELAAVVKPHVQLVVKAKKENSKKF